MPGRSNGGRVLLTWEYGHNSGHISRLLAIARMVEAQGHEPLLVLPGAYMQAPLLQGTPYARMVAPALRAPAMAGAPRMGSFADILLATGFGDVAALRRAVEQWLRLLQAQEPQCIVLDYAPAAQLAAQLMGLPAFQITNGFDAPPADCPPFDFGVRGPYIEQRNAGKLALLGDALAQVGQQILGQPGPTVEAYFSYPSRVYDCIAESDPYGPRDSDLYVGPLAGLQDTDPTAWPARATDKPDMPRIFAYLHHVTDAKAWFDALQCADANTLCVWPDVPEELLQQQDLGKVHITRQHVNMGRALEEADVVVNCGSTTTVCLTLLAGKPQLMLPTDVEKALVARKVAAQGAGLIWQQGRETCGEALQRLLQVSAAAQAAKCVAAKYSGAQLQHRQQLFAQAIGRACQGQTMLPATNTSTLDSRRGSQS